MAELVARKIAPDRVASLLRPLTGASPTGVELDHRDERFRGVLGELDKLGSMSSDPDWSRVMSSAEALLTNKTKDLRLAVALARAWWEGKHGETNLVHGVRLVAGLVAEFWPALHPAPSDRPERFDALDLFAVWIDERWSSAALALPVPDRAAVAEALTGLCSAVGEALHDDAPDLSACERLVHALQRSLPVAAPEPEPEPEPEPAAAPEPPKAAPPVARPAPTAPRIAPDTSPDPTTADDALTFLKGLRARTLTAASLLRRVDPAAALAYRLARQTVWQHLDDLTPDSKGRLPWAPPHRRDVDALDRLTRAQQWDELIDLCEDTLPAQPLWLDLQRHAANALAQRGHLVARRAVEHELRGLLVRLPALGEHRFNDGTAVADNLTRTWLAELAGGGDGPASIARPTDPAGLQAAAERAASGRERFLLRRDLARACLASGRGDVAAGLLAALRDEAHRHDLAVWEPELLVACLSELVACARILGSEARVRLGLDHALAELSALNPAVALGLGRDPADPRT
ncbi:TssA family type VI secretion system protein [Nannocystis sp. SCPEA4]|uniref:TssA family type VI secretion system protein n=1 Tax=Nannocystis sp. SCPEA4 TaxID=2996787 RepID=UPI002270B691|nr:TssA family type VI secretion system protein [Nannocystis sp. SCPEA4]